jgi:hypothetical protein
MLTAALALALATPAAAVEPCRNQPETRVIAKGLGVLESIVADHRGRIVFSESPGEGAGRLLRLNRRGGTPYPVVEGIESPGGLILYRKNRLLAGFGNSIAGGAIGNLIPQAGLYLADPRTGHKEIFAEGLMMGNGLTRAPDGTIYASDDAGIGIDRIENRQVTNRWAPVVSGNGLEADRANKWLYVNTTFRPAAIDRVEIANPSNVEPFFRAGPGDITGGPDGMEIDERDNLYSAINLAGQVWKIGPEGRACLLADGIPQASDLVFGKTKRKARLHRGNLYVTSFNGTVTEIRGVRPRIG